MAMLCSSILVAALIAVAYAAPAPKTLTTVNNKRATLLCTGLKEISIVSSNFFSGSDTAKIARPCSPTDEKTAMIKRCNGLQTCTFVPSFTRSDSSCTMNPSTFQVIYNCVRRGTAPKPVVVTMPPGVMGAGFVSDILD